MRLASHAEAPLFCTQTLCFDLDSNRLSKALRFAKRSMKALQPVPVLLPKVWVDHIFQLFRFLRIKCRVLDQSLNAPLKITYTARSR